MLIYWYQYLYVMVIYSFLGLYILFVRDFKLLKEKKFGNMIIDKYFIKEVVIILLSKVWFVFMMIVVLVMVIGLFWGLIFLVIFVMMFVVGIFIVIVFFLVYVIYDSDYVFLNDDGVVEMDFMIYQILIIVDYLVENKLIYWFFGGINIYVVYYMFLGVNYIYYYDLIKIVKEIVVEYNIRYVNKFFNMVM